MKEITGKELYEMAMELAKEWNHGIVPIISVREGFLFNVLTYPEQYIHKKLKIVLEDLDA